MVKSKQSIASLALPLSRIVVRKHIFISLPFIHRTNLSIHHQVKMGPSIHSQQQSVENPYRSESSSMLAKLRRLWANLCEVGYDQSEFLDYDYSYDVTQKGRPQPPPRARERGEMYIDSFNSEPWSCSFGTSEENGTWMNTSDQAGTIMAALVWLLMLYSCVTVMLLTATRGIPPAAGMVYCVLCFMALACHAKTSLSDPGSVPRAAVPCESQRQTQTSHSMCGQCQTFKPPASHHCRICNRCVSRMDHHCPWMNNCVGAGNLSTFHCNSGFLLPEIYV